MMERDLLKERERMHLYVRRYAQAMWDSDVRVGLCQVTGPITREVQQYILARAARAIEYEGSLPKWEWPLWIPERDDPKAYAISDCKPGTLVEIYASAPD